jgi:hypothetical protein
VTPPLLVGRSMWRETLMLQPECICRTCWNVWRAQQPPRQAVFCHHLGGAARRTDSGRLLINECISAYALASLRASDAL